MATCLLLLFKVSFPINTRARFTIYLYLDLDKLKHKLRMGFYAPHPPQTVSKFYIGV